MAVGLAFVGVFTGIVLPRILLKTHAATLPVRDKAIERLSDKYGTLLHYAPSAAVRRYLESYWIGNDENGAYFRGEWTSLIAFAEYELTVYDSENEIVEILRVKEKFNVEGPTHVTRLPKGADYVTVRFVCVDDTPVPAERKPFSARYALWLAVLCLFFALTVDFLLWICVSFVLCCFDNFTMRLSLPPETWAALLGYTALGVAAATCVFSLGGFFLRKKGVRHEKR